MTQDDKIKEAVDEGNIHYCPNCKEKRPVELTYYNPDEDAEPTLITCLICSEGIGFIEAL